MDVQFLTKGSLVEVSTAEEGFGNVWFEATVVSPPPSARKKKTQKDKFCVEYKTLCCDDDLSVPLREFVDASCIRPLPPASGNDTSSFEVYDVVDAWYQDGWWSGVITRAFEGLRFLVTFQNPPDELEFRGSELRFHVDWVNDSWVRPPKQKVPGLIFGEGKEVEVSINIRHNHDVWYPATVVENHADSTFLVEYKVLKEGTHETEPRKSTVDCSHIRPIPPVLKDRCFDLLEKVDAFHELGWWAGLVTKELPDKRYNVFFQSTKGVGEFDLANVRPQLNWKDGKWWFTSSQEKVSLCQENHGGLVDNELNDISSLRTCKTKVSLKGKKMKQKASISRSSRESNPSEILRNSPCTPKGAFAGTYLEGTEFPSTSLIKNQTGHVNMDYEKSHGIASSPKKGKHTIKNNMQLAKKLKRGGGALTLPRTSSQQNTTISDRQNGKINLTSGSPTSNNRGDNMLIYLSSEDDEPFSAGTRTAKMQTKIDAKENHTHRSGRKQGQAGKQLFGEERNDGFPKVDEHVELDSGRDKASPVFILGLECSKLSGSKAGKSCLNNEEKCPKLDWDQKKQLHNLPEQHKGDQSESGKSSQKRKRGRPPKVSRASPNAERKENSLMPIGDCVTLACAEISCLNDSVSTTANCSLKPTDTNDQDLISEHKRQMSNKAKRRTTSENKISLISDSSDGTTAKTAQPICITKEVTRTVQQEHGMFDDQPLSKWFEKTQTSDPVDSSSQGASTAMMAEQSIALRHTMKEKNGQNTFTEDNKTEAVMSEEVDADNCVPADSDKVIEQLAELNGQTGKELNGQTTFINYNKTVAVMSEEIDAHNCVLADGHTVVDKVVELKKPGKELNGKTLTRDKRTAAVISEEVDAHNCVLVDTDIVAEQFVETGKELNGQTTSVKVKKTAPFIGEEADGRSLALVHGGTSMTTAGEPKLPFVKCSSLWKAIESMEAFRKVPQEPHFRPLQQYKQSLREGLAIAFMVNFASVVEKISMLQFDDTKEKINDILDSLKDLESHGFSVQVLLDRVTQLESIKEGHTKLFEEVDVLNKQILSSKFDKLKYDKEIIEVSKQIKELTFQKTRLENLKVATDDELELLESRLGDAEEAIESARSRYEGLASGVL